ncbi:MAG TPA: DNA-3-methyladenine glycosylase I [Candidatus Nanopelagicaceae bacterium]|nr:DNA-3-methyladenine glycosylase I [Candidatus Nanopelagicaceae bacterium]
MAQNSAEHVGNRCSWAVGVAEAYVDYHDHEWGQPVMDDRGLFERVCLEGFQAGLSWWTILSRRPDFRLLFADFDPEIVANYQEGQILSLSGDSRIIRHQGKIRAAIGNARATINLGAGGLTQLVWSHQPTPGLRPASAKEIPTQSVESIALAKALKAAGFSFTGPTSAYALMQACGLVNDHTLGCPAGDRLDRGDRF